MVDKFPDKELSRRDALRKIGGTIFGAAVVAGAPKIAEAQKITQSVAEPTIGMFAEQSGFPQEYQKKFEAWVKKMVKEPKIKKEIDAVANLPVDLSLKGGKYAEVIFAANDGLPKELQFISPQEVLKMHINRSWHAEWGPLHDGEVVLVMETYIDPKDAPAYKNKGIPVDSGDRRILKASTVYDSKTGQFRSW